MMYSFTIFNPDIDLNYMIKDYLSQRFAELMVETIEHKDKIEGYIYTVEIENKLKVYDFSNTYNLIPFWERQIENRRQKEILEEFKRVINEAN